MNKLYILLITTSLILTSCSGQIKGVNNEGLGTVLGGVIGGFMGSTLGSGTGKLASIGVSTLLGAGIGNRIGHNMDKIDRKYYRKTSHNAFEHIPSGHTVEWINPETGTSGSFTPISSLDIANNSYCRKFKETLTVAGNSQEGYGTACRQSDGEWKIVN